MKLGDLVKFKPMNRPSSLRYLNLRMDHLGQYIEAGTKGMVINTVWVDQPPGQPDPLDEYPYIVYTILTSTGVRTPGWTENVFDIIAEGK